MRRLVLTLLVALLSFVLSSDGGGQSLTGGITVTGNPLNVGASHCFVLFRIGISSTCAFTPTGGTGQGYSFTLVSGAGNYAACSLSDISSAGTVTGTPSAATCGSETFKLCDSSGQCTTNQTQTITADTMTGTGPCGTALCMTAASIGFPYTTQSIQVSMTLQLQVLSYWAVTPALDVTSLVAYSNTGTPGGSISASGLYTAGGSSGTETLKSLFNGVTDDGGAGIPVTVTSGSITPTITNALALPNGQIGQLYPEGSGAGVQLNVTCTGCTLPFTWTSVSGNPTGLVVSAAGLISGTPTASGTFSSWNIQVCDAASHCTTGVFTAIIASNTSLAVSPSLPTVPQNSTLQFAAACNYSDSTTAPCPLPTSSGAAIQLVQAKAAQASGVTSLQVTPNAAVTSSNNVYDFCSQHADNTHTITRTDSGAQSYVAVGADNTFYDAFNLANVGKVLNSSAITNETCTTGAAASLMTNILLEISGAATASDIDGTVQTPGSTTQVTSLPSGSITIANAVDMLVYCVNVITDETFTPGTNFALAAVTSRAACEYRVVSSVGTYSANMTWNASGQAGGVFFAVKQATPTSGIVWSTNSCAGTGSTVGDIGSTTGLFQALVAGTCSVVATLGAVNGSTTVTVQGGTDTALIISPPSATVLNGSSQLYTVKGNVTGKDLTSSSKFASDNAAVTISGNSATCVAGSGSAHISAQSGTIGTGSNPALQTCATASTSALLTGCTVTESNNTPTCATPAGWTLIAAEGFGSGHVHSITLGSGTSITNTIAHGGSFSAVANINAQGAGPSLFSSNGAFGTVYISYWEWKDANGSMNDELFITDLRHVVSGALQQEIIADRFNFGGFNSSQAQPVIEPQGNHFGNLFGTPVGFGAGAWHQWEVKYHPNTPGNSDGAVQIFLDGVSMLNRTGVNINGTINMANSTLQIGGNYGKSVWTNNGQRPNAGGTCSAAPGTIEAGFWIGLFNAALNPGNCAPAPPTFNLNIDDVIIIGQ